MAHLPKAATMADYQTYIQKTCEERGWDKRTSLEKMLFLTEEVGELAKAVRKEYGTYGYDKPQDTTHLAEELVDLDQAFRDKWNVNDTRDWTGDYGKAA